jgi:hypothetical protein
MNGFGLKNGLKTGGLMNGFGLKNGLPSGGLTNAEEPNGACTTVASSGAPMTIAEALPANTKVMANNAAKTVMVFSIFFISFPMNLMTSSPIGYPFATPPRIADIDLSEFDLSYIVIASILNAEQSFTKDIFAKKTFIQ